MVIRMDVIYWIVWLPITGFLLFVIIYALWEIRKIRKTLEEILKKR